MTAGQRLVRYKVTVRVDGPGGEQLQVTWAGYEGPPTADDKDKLATSAAAAFEAAFGVRSMKFSDDVGVQFDISKADAVYLERIDNGVKIVGLQSRRHVEQRLLPGGTVALVGGKFMLTDAGEEALAEVRRTGFGAEVRAVAG